MPMVSEARIRANKKYLSKRENILFRVRKGRKAVMKARAESLGKSLNAYINDLVEKDIGASD